MDTSALRRVVAEPGSGLRDALGLARSLWLYRRPGRQRGLRRLYAPFIAEGDLVFDIGAHVGDRALAFAALGARVLALEPQPMLARFLQRTIGRRRRVEVLEQAVGAAAGVAELQVSRATPTVSSIDARWTRRIGARNRSFAAVRWDRRIEVPVTTLDELIEIHGRPGFCKIDVEGHEAEVLAGLSRPLPALSVEFVAGALDVAGACVDRLEGLGEYRFNAVAGEQRRFQWDDWRPAGPVRDWLAAGADGLASGDLYARLVDATLVR
ncbi:MAG: FkbM family methyltransferase [Wenzhouxiangellaceae bacterium]|nr:FkbM family methyltransferase [Wenzhouxiangellaceae bacterium]MBS3824045.1 FkbM family methyltransferase [Wenzhouxiangellaceae bacterium]